MVDELSGQPVQHAPPYPIKITEPKEWVAHLCKLQDRCPAMPASQVRDILQTELGEAAAKELEAEFESEPLGSASIAQVPRAKLARRRVSSEAADDPLSRATKRSSSWLCPMRGSMLRTSGRRSTMRSGKLRAKEIAKRI